MTKYLQLLNNCVRFSQVQNHLDKVLGECLDGPPQPYRSGVDGIAISNDGTRLFYSALMGRRLFSVSSDALVNRALDDATVATTIVDEGDKSSMARATA